MNHCTGLLGKRCTCGRVHEGPTGRPSMFANGWFWIAGVVSALLWVLADWAVSVYWPH